ncbi:MAG: cell division protein SepF [Clostridiales bacterium]|nr:cell division protein SepF [Spirochaetaceae bacterium]MBE7074014.1 cell division protein SepF [Clostridiales bacterium]
MGFMGGFFRALGFEGEKKPKAEKKNKSQATYSLNNKGNKRVDQIDGVSVYYPEIYDHIFDFAGFVMEGKPIIISLEGCDKENSNRILDFLNGFIFASNARMINLDKETLYLILPEGMSIEE